MCAKFGDRVSAMPVISYVAISESPPIIGVSCSPTSFTYWLAREAGAFSLCWVDRRLAGCVEYLAAHSGRGGNADKLQSAGLQHTKGRILDVPIVLESEAAVECSVTSTTSFGDHILMVGKVEAAFASSDFRDYWRFRSYEPILYTGWHAGLGFFEK